MNTNLFLVVMIYSLLLGYIKSPPLMKLMPVTSVNELIAEKIGRLQSATVTNLKI
ncbi:MAG: hypothetical protein ACRD4J_07035 [Nitrososphaeraceae archaeon]